MSHMISDSVLCVVKDEPGRESGKDLRPSFII